MVKLGETENLLDVLMQGANSCDDRFIAVMFTLVILEIAF